ncbi:unnamed protein product [Paramecium sonneborni]|uniref:Casein kinase I n=1 Tax=Paramecium sonneborni TaxID=65129 RepID=A0A8S1MS38_9CILI|nr:unnamed protein product [Paramecium sonneborni]
MADPQQYKVLCSLGYGSEHIVYKAELNLNSQLYAIKLEKCPGVGQLKNEIEMLQKLSGVEGIPQIKQFGQTLENRYFLIVPLYHSNLLDLAKSRKLSLTQILSIGLRIIEIIEKVHKKKILHLDIKPENIMLSQQCLNDQDILQPGFIQLIDFGLSQQFNKDSESLKDVFIGSLNFASRSSHNGTPLGYKDDLESLLYVLFYIRDLRLPWSEKRFWGFKEVDFKLVGQTKSSFFKSNDFQSQSLLNFEPFMSYINQLTYDIMPDYDYIKSLFTQMISKSYTMQSIFKHDKQQTFSNSYYVDSIIISSDTIQMQIDNIPKSNNHQDIQDDIFHDSTSTLISKIIGKYNTHQIKSIKDIQY